MPRGKGKQVSSEEPREAGVSSDRMRGLSLRESRSRRCCIEDEVPQRESCASEFSTGSQSPGRFSAPASPLAMSPWCNFPNRLSTSLKEFQGVGTPPGSSYRCVMSMLKRDGHIFSLAACDGLVYTGSESKTIRVWSYSDFAEYSSFESGSGNVRALLVAHDRIFSAHQDRKIRVWRRSRSNPRAHRRIATLPTLKDSIYRGINPQNYLATGCDRVSARHSDVVSSLAYSRRDDLLYSGSWDKTVKVWRMSDFRCVETITAHSDIVNAVAVGHAEGFLFTGSDDSTVKVWRRVVAGANHSLVATLQIQFSPVKALALSAADGSILYAGCSDGYIQYWENAQRPAQMSHAGNLRGHRHAILCLATNRNLVFSGSADTTIRVWLRGVGVVHRCLAVLEDCGGPIKCIAATSDDANGCLVYSGRLDGMLKVWWVGASTKLEPLSFHDRHQYSGLYETR